MLGTGPSGAWQLPGRTSVVPGGHGWPGATRVPPRMPPGPWAAVIATRPSARAATDTRDAVRMALLCRVLLTLDPATPGGTGCDGTRLPHDHDVRPRLRPPAGPSEHPDPAAGHLP